MADSLRVARTRRGISTAELAVIAGVDRGTIEDIERGQTKTPRYRTMRAIALGLGIKDEGSIREFASARATLANAHGREIGHMTSGNGG